MGCLLKASWAKEFLVYRPTNAVSGALIERKRNRPCLTAFIQKWTNVFTGSKWRLMPNQRCYCGANVQTVKHIINLCYMEHSWKVLAPLHSRLLARQDLNGWVHWIWLSDISFNSFIHLGSSMAYWLASRPCIQASLILYTGRRSRFLDHFFLIHRFHCHPRCQLLV